MYSVISLGIFLAAIIYLRHLFNPTGLYKKIYCVLLVKLNVIVLLYFLFFYNNPVNKENIYNKIDKQFFSTVEVTQGK